MPLMPSLRPFALATGLALLAGGAVTPGAMAQDATAPAATTEQAAPAPVPAATATDPAATTAPAATEAAGGATATTDTAATVDAAAADAAPADAAPAAPDAAAPDAAALPPLLAGGKDLPVIGAPHLGGTGFQPASTPVAVDLQWLDGMLNWIITPIVLLVTALLAWVAIRYNARRNPTPAGFTHNSPLEIAWTIVPIVILVFIGAFSLPVLFEEQEIPVGDIHIKATGYQWFWHYDYTDEAVGFDAYMIGYGAAPMTEAESDPVRLELVAQGFDPSLYKLAADQAVVVPVGKVVVVTVTGGDVIHSWKIPAFGSMQDAVPGRLAQTWFKADAIGVYFGQCSELCGKDHAFMPITVRVVSQEDYDAWLVRAKSELAA